MTATTIRDWLKSLRSLNDAHLYIMTLTYDLDGAIAGGQPGLAWWAQEAILLQSVRLFTIEAGLKVEGQDWTDQAFRRLERLAAVNPTLANRAWELWLRPLPTRDRLPDAIEETFTFVREDLGLPWALDRHSAVLRWAESTQVLRAVAQNLGIAQSNHWYLTSEGNPDSSWFDDVVKAMETEQS